MVAISWQVARKVCQKIREMEAGHGTFSTLSLASLMKPIVSKCLFSNPNRRRRRCPFPVSYLFHAFGPLLCRRSSWPTGGEGDLEKNSNGGSGRNRWKDSLFADENREREKSERRSLSVLPLCVERERGKSCLIEGTSKKFHGVSAESTS